MDDDKLPDGKIIFRVAGPDVFYVHFNCDTGTTKYVGVVRRVITSYRNGNAVFSWEPVGKPPKLYKRRIEAARALI